MIKNIIKTATLTALTTVALSANNIQINPVTDIEPVIKQIEKANLKKPKRTKRSYSVENISNFTYDQTRDTIDTISDDQGPLFYLVRNKVQFDPTVDKTIFDEKLRPKEFACNDGKCDGYKYFTDKIPYSNTVGANIMLNELPSEDMVLFSRKHANNLPDYYKLMGGKPFFKVYIDTEGYLQARYTLITGGTTSAKSDKPIPLGEKVYIQANEVGSAYDVGWKSYSSNETSTGHSNRQVALPSFADIENLKFAIENINKLFQAKYTDHTVTNWFWNTDIPMFANFGASDLSNMYAYQKNSELTVNNVFVSKILFELKKQGTYFTQDTMRVYVNDNQDVLAVDVRQTR